MCCSTTTRRGRGTASARAPGPGELGLVSGHVISVLISDWSRAGELSEERDNDSLGDSKHWDSGVGSSSERTSTLSVTDNIRR